MKVLENKVLFRDKSKNLILIGTLLMISLFEYMLIILFNNLSNNSYSESITLTKYVVVITLFLFVFLAVYLNMFIIEDSHFQLAVLMVNGRSSFSMTKQVMKYYLSLLFIITCLGSFMGYFIIDFILNRKIGNLIYINSEDFYQSIYLILLFFIIKAVYIFILNIGKFRDIRFKLINYLNNISRKENKVGYFSSFIVEKETKRFPYIKMFILILLLMVFFGAFHSICINQINHLDFFIAIIGILISFVCITKLIIPMLFDILHKYLLKSKRGIIAYNDFISLYQNLFLLIITVLVFIPIYFYLIFISENKQNMIYLFCYMITVVSLLMCCYFKYYVYFSGKKKQIMTLNSIGYTFKDIHKIQLRELSFLLIILSFLPVTLFIIMFLKSNREFMNLIPLFIYVLSLVLLYMFDRVLIKNKMKEVIENEQQFNRSE